MIADPAKWGRLPDQVSDWLRIQQQVGLLPARDSLLIETFPRGERFFMVPTRSRDGWRTRRWACC
jgi:ATP-dependent Lhr-like helicase